MLNKFRKEEIERRFADSKELWASVLPVTGIEECKRTGSPYCSLPKYKKDCNTLSQAGKSVLQFFRLI
jgi:hypothetical protein